MMNQTSAIMSWAPPPPQHRNGILRGYQIHVKGNGSYFHSNITLNATTTNYILANLSLNEEYSVRAVAFTNVGLGPFSPPTNFLMDPAYLKFTVGPTGGLKSIFFLFFREMTMLFLFGGKSCIILHEPKYLPITLPLTALEIINSMYSKMEKLYKNELVFF